MANIDIMAEIKKYSGLKAYIANDDNLIVTLIPFGIPQLDAVIGGGVPQSRITEIVGDFSVGKSFVTLKLIQSAQSMGLSTVLFNCVPKGTHIIVKAHRQGATTKINVENIKVGDKILSYNNETGEKEEDTVVRTACKNSDSIVKFVLSNGNELFCTPEHKIGIVDGGNIKWILANDVCIGDKLVQKRYKELFWRIDGIRAKGKSYIERYGVDTAVKKQKKQSEKIKSLIADPKSGYNTERYKQETLARLQSFWDDPIYVAKMRAASKKKTPAKKAADIRRSVTFKELWRNPNSIFNDPEFRNRRASAIAKANSNANGMSTEEEIFLKLMSDLVPGEFKYNGDGSVMVLGGKVPDFVDINGKKKLIEVFGNYWHNGEDENIRINYFRQYGWDTLVVWASEFRNMDILKDKVTKFIFNPDVDIVEVTNKIISEKQTMVYDIETEKNHNFFAYGILVHNCENKFDPIWARKVGVDLSKLHVVQGNTGDSVLDAIFGLISVNVGLIVVDSIATLIPTSVLEAPMADQNMAAQARMLSKGFAKITSPLSISKTAVVFINQLRASMSAYAADVYSGGKAQYYYSSLTIHIRRGDWIEDNNKNRKGFRIMFRAVKNTLAPPWRESSAPFLFTGEIDQMLTLCEIALDVGIIKKTAGWYTLHDEQRKQGWENVVEYYKTNPKAAKELSQKIGGE